MLIRKDDGTMDKRYHLTIRVAFFLTTAFCFAGLGRAQDAMKEWPRTFFKDGATNVMYQPQMESWDYVTLKASAAVSVQPLGAPQPTFGTIHFVAKTEVDRANREVAFTDIQISSADFPTGDSQADKYLATFRSVIPTGVKTMSL